MKNRKKALKLQTKLQAKQKITTHVIQHINKIIFYKIKCHYIALSDTFVCELYCIIQNKRLAIKGIINPENLVDDGILIEAPFYLQSEKYNCTEINLSKNDAPHFYELVKTYVYNIGDRLDANLSHTIDLNFENKIGVNDVQLKEERENFLNVYKIEEKK